MVTRQENIGTDKVDLKEIFLVFFKLGWVAFGGPAAHIALMEEEIVKKRKWMSEQHFLDLVGATNIVPGPNSTEMTMHCGYEKRGLLGLVVAGASFIFPAVFITGIIAWFYMSYGELPAVQPFIEGIKPAVLVVILSAVIKLGKKALKDQLTIAIGIAVVVVCAFGFSEIYALLGAGILAIAIQKNKSSQIHKSSLFPLIATYGINTEWAVKQITHFKIFFTFLKIGAILYGSGYVLFAYVDTFLVNEGYLTRQQLLDAIAIGQFTPGPVLSTATFIGYQLGGIIGALAATLGIFLPSFFFVFLLNKALTKWQKSKIARAFLDAVNAASVAIMAWVLIELTGETLVNWQSMFIALTAALLTFTVKKWSAVYTIILGAVLGYLTLYVFPLL